jgi:hypothetical protein
MEAKDMFDRVSNPIVIRIVGVLRDGKPKTFREVADALNVGVEEDSREYIKDATLSDYLNKWMAECGWIKANGPKKSKYRTYALTKHYLEDKKLAVEIVEMVRKEYKKRGREMDCEGDNPADVLASVEKMEPGEKPKKKQTLK